MLNQAPEFWTRRGWTAALLWPLSGLFCALAALRRIAYLRGWRRQQRLPVPVVVVGNLAVGGSGKTPVVLYLAERLRAAGWCPGILSRGYGGERPADEVLLVAEENDARRCGDEPLLLARASGCPVAVGRDRAAAGRALLAAHPACDVLLCDDGLQHYRLARDCEVIVVDESVLGNAWRLPAGPLREGLNRLASADVLVWHGAVSPALRARAEGTPSVAMRLEGAELISLFSPVRSCAPSAFAGRRVHAFAGIGRPARFFAHLRALGLQVEEHPRPDHHAYAAADFAGLSAEPVVVTAKDAVKCAPFAPPDSWVLPVRAAFDADLGGLILETLAHGRKAA